MHTVEKATLCHIPGLLKAIQFLQMSYDLHLSKKLPKKLKHTNAERKINHILRKL